MVRLTDLLLMAKKQIPAWKKANRHYRYTMSRPWTIQAQVQNLPGIDRPKVQVEPVKEWKIFKGDLVQVLKGRDFSKLGLVIDIIKQRNWVIVEGLNCDLSDLVESVYAPMVLGLTALYDRSYTLKSSADRSYHELTRIPHYRRIGKMKGYSGTMIKSEGPLDVREVALVDPSDNKPTDIDFRYTEAGEKVRVSKRTGRIIPIPIVDSDSRDYKTKESYVEQAKDSVAEDVCKKTFEPSLKTVEEELMEAYDIKETRKPAKTYWY